MLAEPPIHVTRMTRCKVCGAGFASANQVMSTELDQPYVEMCPGGHVDEYASGDYYFL